MLSHCNGCEVDRKGGRGSFDVRCFASEGGQGLSTRPEEGAGKAEASLRVFWPFRLGFLQLFFLLCHWLGQTPVEFTV